MSDPGTPPKETLENIIAGWAASVRNRDIDGVIRHHASDMLMFDLVGPTELRGLDAYRKSWLEQFFPWHGGTGRFEVRELNVVAGDRVAFATALLDCAGTEQGQPAAYTLRLTVGFQKPGDDWLIVHEHHSEPLP